MKFPCSKSDFKFSVVTYNILSQTLLNQHSYLYMRCNPQDVRWPTRGPRIVSKIIAHQADIICLQEVDCKELEELLQPKLKKFNYECVYKKKTGQKMDGCAVFYKSNVFNLHSYKGVEFNRIDIDKILTKDQVGLIAVLEPKRNNSSQEDERLIVANTHLIFNPRRVDIKLAQIQLFLKELDESSQYYNSESDLQCRYPTILCGDLNSTPDSDLCNYITKESTAFNFESAYPHCESIERQLVSSLSRCVVDYIYYTPDLKLIKKHNLPTVNNMNRHGHLPNSKEPSDHFLLKAKFMLPRI